MSRRLHRLLVAVSLGAAVLAAGISGGCAARTVSVRTGERVVCTNGEEVSSTVRTIKVASKDAGKYSVKTTRITCDKHSQLEELYSDAQAALGTQDFKTAQTKLAEVVKLDAKYKLASSQLAAIKNGTKPAPDASAGTSGSTGSSGATGTAQPSGGGQAKPGEAVKPEGPVATLLVYTPDSITGYKARPVAADAFSVSRVYLPVSSGNTASLVVVAEQHRSGQAAAAWLKTNVKQLYTQSARNVRVGSREAYMATDGKRFAIIGWTAGPVTVAIEVDTGARPTDAFKELQAIANSVVR